MSRAPFDEEEVTNYEIGWKAGWADGHLRTQLNAFYNEYDNFQVIVGYPDIPVFGFELNNPNTTKIYGFEAQVEAVFGDFSLDAGIGWMQSELGEFFAVDPRAPSFGACDPETGPASAVVHQSRRARPDLCAGTHVQHRHAVRVRTGRAATRSRRASTSATSPSSGRRCSRTRRAAIASKRATS